MLNVVVVLVCYFLSLIFVDKISGLEIIAHQIVLKQGIVEGKTDISRNGTIFLAYYNLPYAKPPVGRLRFQVILILSIYFQLCLSYARK